MNASVGRATHLGPDLTREQVEALPDGAEVVVTWSGGNGPWPYRVLVEARDGTRCAESLYCDPLYGHRVTLGWNEAARAWVEQASPRPAEVIARWERLRGGEAS